MASAWPGPAADVAWRERPVARPADEALVDLVAARLVDEHGGWSTGAGEVLVAPPHQGNQDRRELDPHRGELVLVPRRVSAVLAPLEHASVDELAEAVGENRACHSQVAPELIEAAHASKDVAQDKDRPAVADDL